MTDPSARWWDPTPAALLNAWERAAHQPAGRRALALLSTVTDDELDAVSVGVRDAALLTLRERLFGSAVSAVVACPDCGERQELSFLVDEIRAPRPDPLPDLQVSASGQEAQFRLPTGADLDALAGDGDLDRAVDRLLDACLVSVTADPGELSEDLVAAVAERMAQADPQADVRLALRCDACDTAWVVPFDIAAFLWCEVDAWAWRLLAEVHQLARAYGWSEREVLALSARRRQVYLELAAP